MINKNKKVRNKVKVYIYPNKIIVPIFIFGKSDLKARSLTDQQMRIKRGYRCNNNTQIVTYLVFNNCTRKISSLQLINKYSLNNFLMLKNPIIKGKHHRIIKIEKEKLRDILKNYLHDKKYWIPGAISGGDLTALDLINESIRI